MSNQEPKRLSEMLTLWNVQNGEGQVTASAVANTLTTLGISRSTVYNALNSLSEQGLLSKDNTFVAGSPKVVYSTTPAALPHLKTLREVLRDKDSNV